MPVDVANLHYVLSAIASTGKIIETSISLLSKGMRADYDALKIEADRYAEDLIAQDDPDKIDNLAASVPEKILETVKDNIRQLHMQVAGTLKNLGMDLPEIEKRVDDDHGRICFYIVQLSKFGEIPESMLVIWKNSKCADKGFALA
ncbi:hypothetical protein [Methylobacterium sp. E-046]|uniref:hypothetical protein n=1 Tax=Methylobacterium sp. E-046 TaxID=2836576 RepID=UPI001FBBBDE0|nr:hypothetical protein [Methylobacterium sp. E-046]MCJ2097460.1 hypothetical protein [Methylobacterium sp. E-046]